MQSESENVWKISRKLIEFFRKVPDILFFPGKITTLISSCKVLSLAECCGEFRSQQKTRWPRLRLADLTDLVSPIIGPGSMVLIIIITIIAITIELVEWLGRDPRLRQAKTGC